ncbi:ribonuclease P protein subunit p20 [Anastrepha ludens]|uniref:ribonuclease P protein subunit p20 n=1 Tax=Anastrepha ludens TaxID=28586 RepID=UPI0023AFA2F9|nr:ribonuclease P protein subunit p20 [Anastrepha ludens]
MGNLKHGTHVKRIPRKLFNSEHDVYITSNSSFEAQVKHCTNIFNLGGKEIFIHCLGSSISRCLNLVLHLVKKSDLSLSYSIHTSTIHLIDESHPLHEDRDVTLKKRSNSAVHVRLTRHMS